MGKGGSHAGQAVGTGLPRPTSLSVAARPIMAFEADRMPPALGAPASVALCAPKAAAESTGVRRPLDRGQTRCQPALRFRARLRERPERSLDLKSVSKSYPGFEARPVVRPEMRSVVRLGMRAGTRPDHASNPSGARRRRNADAVRLSENAAARAGRPRAFPRARSRRADPRRAAHRSRRNTRAQSVRHAAAHRSRPIP